MGNCVSQNEAYSVLRTSIVGVLIPTESEFAEFFDCCRVEKHGLKSVLNINLLQSFYVVVSGEVQVCLTSKDGKSVVINSFKTGEMIHFFRANSISCSGSGIINSVCNLRLNLQFKSDTDNVAQVIGIDRASVDRFLDGKPHLKELQHLMNLQIADFKDFPPFIQLALSQLHFLGPMLKLRMHHVGDVLRYADDGNTTHSNSWQPVPHIKRNKLHKLPPVASKPIGLILSGSYFVLPHDADAETLAREYINTILRMNTVDASSPRSLQANVPITVEKGAQELGATEDRIIYARIMQTVAQMLQVDMAQIFPGSVFGLDHYFIKNYSGQKPIVMSAGRGLVGFLEFDTLRYLFHYEKRLKRVIQRNYLSSILSSVRRLVPILSDMDVKTIHIFAGLVSMKQLEKGDFLYRKSQSSSYCYLIVSGLVKELNALEEKHLTKYPDLFSSVSQRHALAESSSFVNDSDASSDKQSHRPNASLLQFYGAGSLLGEVAVMAGSTHFSTMIISEPTTVIVIPRSTFQRMLYETKYSISPILYSHRNNFNSKPQGTTSLNSLLPNEQSLYHYFSNNIITTELHLSKMGTHAELCHVLPHPIGNALFLDFLAKEAADENLLFLNEVRKFHLLNAKCQRDMQTLLWSRMYMMLASNPSLHSYHGDDQSSAKKSFRGSNLVTHDSSPHKDTLLPQAPVQRSLTSRLFGLVKSSSSNNSPNVTAQNGSTIHDNNTANAPMLTQPGRQPSLMSSMLRAPSAMGLKVIIEQENGDEENIQPIPLVQTDTASNKIRQTNNASFSEVRPFSVTPSPMSISNKEETSVVAQQSAALSLSSFSSVAESGVNGPVDTVPVNISNNGSSTVAATHSSASVPLKATVPFVSDTNGRPINGTSAVLLTAQYRHQQEEHAQYVKRHHLLTEVSFVASSSLREFAARESSDKSLQSYSVTKLTNTPSALSSKIDLKEDTVNIKQDTLIVDNLEDIPDDYHFQKNLTKQEEEEEEEEEDIFSRPPPSSKFLLERIPSFLDNHLSAHHLNTTAVQLLRRMSPHNSNKSSNSSNSPANSSNNKSWVQAAVSAIQQVASPKNRQNLVHNGKDLATSVDNTPVTDKSDVHSRPHVSTVSTIDNTLSSADVDTVNAKVSKNAHVSGPRYVHDGEDLGTLVHQEATLHMTVLYEYFLGQIHALRVLLENIIHTYIATDSVRQVNLPYHVLKRIMDVYETRYRHMSDEDILLEMIEQLHNDMVDAANGDDHNTHNAARKGNKTTSLNRLDEEDENKVAMVAAVVTGQKPVSSSSQEKELTSIVSFFTLFNAAEMEIMTLLKNGPYLRWQKTPIFQEFIQLVGPAQNTTTPLASQQSSLELASTKHMKPTRQNSFKHPNHGFPSIRASVNLRNVMELMTATTEDAANDTTHDNHHHNPKGSSSSLRKSFHGPVSRRLSAKVQQLLSADAASSPSHHNHHLHHHLNTTGDSAIELDLCRVFSVSDPTATASATTLIPENSPWTIRYRQQHAAETAGSLVHTHQPAFHQTSMNTFIQDKKHESPTNNRSNRIAHDHLVSSRQVTHRSATSPVSLSRSIRRSLSNLLPSPMAKKNTGPIINRLSSNSNSEKDNSHHDHNSVETMLRASLLYQQTQDPEFPIPIPLDLIHNAKVPANLVHNNDGNNAETNKTSANTTEFTGNGTSSKLSMRQSSVRMLQRVSSVVALGATHDNSNNNNSFFRNLSNSNLMSSTGGNRDKDTTCTSAKAAAWVQLMIQQEQLLQSQQQHQQQQQQLQSSLSNAETVDALAASVLQNSVLTDALRHMHQQGALSPTSDNTFLYRGDSTPKLMISPQTSSTSINFHVMASRKHRDVLPLLTHVQHVQQTNNNNVNPNQQHITQRPVTNLHQDRLVQSNEDRELFTAMMHVQDTVVVRDNTPMPPKPTSKPTLSGSHITHETQLQQTQLDCCPLVGNDFSNINTINTSAKTAVNHPSYLLDSTMTQSNSSHFHSKPTTSTTGSQYWLMLPSRSNSNAYSSSLVITKPSPNVHTTTLAVQSNIDPVHNTALTKPRPTMSNTNLADWLWRPFQPNPSNSTSTNKGWLIGNAKKSNVVGISG